MRGDGEQDPRRRSARPAVVARTMDADGSPGGIQRIWIDEKRSLGSTGGCAVRLLTGKPTGAYVVAEGVVTTLSAMKVMGLTEGYAMLGTAWKFDPPEGRPIEVAVDNDKAGVSALLAYSPIGCTPKTAKSGEASLWVGRLAAIPTLLTICRTAKSWKSKLTRWKTLLTQMGQNPRICGQTAAPSLWWIPATSTIQTSR